MAPKIRTNGVYVVDFAVAAPEEDELVKMQNFVSYLTLGVDKKDDEFITSLLEKTCMYEKQWLPKPIHNLALIMKEEFSNFALGMDVADEEAEAIAGRSLQELFERSGVNPARVDVLLCVSTQATLLQRAVIGKFGFREDLEVLTLGGMGCSGGVMSTDFANKYLSQRKTPTTMAAICHETITRGFYTGLSRASMVTNALFRANACAMMFSTDPSLKVQAKFKLEYSTRTYQTDDLSFWSMGYKLDESGVGGIYLPKKDELGDISARAIRHTMARVGREILPVGEKLKYVLSGGRKVPDFTKAVDHVFVHPGGPAVIEKFGKALGYDAAVETVNSINAYYFYGNTSSAGVLYSMAYTESLRGIKRGDRLLALGLGAGFESNGTVMTALRDCRDVHRAWKHVAEDPSLQSLAVDAFVEGFRNRKRICRLESSDERKVQDLKEYAEKRGYKSPYGPEPADGVLISHSTRNILQFMNASPPKDIASVSSPEVGSVETDSDSVSSDRTPVTPPVDSHGKWRLARKLPFDQPKAVI